MILGASELYKNWTNEIAINGEIEKHDLVENLSNDFVIEGTTIDVRLDEVFSTINNSLGYQIYLNKRQTAKLYTERLQDNHYNIYSNKSYIVTTMEKLFIPNFLQVKIAPRMTLIKNNLFLNVSVVNPGFYGVLTFGLFNLGTSIVEIERGVRIAQLTFEEIKGSCTPYNGQWQGGKITSNGEFVEPR